MRAVWSRRRRVGSRLRWGGGSALRVGGIDRVGPIHGRRGGMARMVVLVVLVILWRFPGVMRVP
jgi:hypothetical protein